MNEFYRPLTPKLRNEIRNSIGDSIKELNTCENNAFVNIQKTGLLALDKLFKNLPDGYLVPFNKNK